jgi:hypothetical protein
MQEELMVAFIPMSRWHEIVNNPVLWVESVEDIRRTGGEAAFGTKVAPPPER